MYLALSDLQP